MSETQETEKLVAATDERVRPQTAEQDSQTDGKMGESGGLTQPASTDAAAKKWIGLAVAAVAVVVIAIVVFFAFGGSGTTADNATNDSANASAANANASAATNANQAATSSGSSRLTKDADSSNAAGAADNAVSSDATNGETITYTYVTTTTKGGESTQGDGYIPDGASEGWGGSEATGTDPDDGALYVYVTVDCSRAPGYEGVMFEDWVKLSKGATAYDALVATGLPVGGNSTYVSSIGGLAEKFPGYEGGSGWMYVVNGAIPNVSCGKYVLSENDTLVWAYTLDLGNDL